MKSETALILALILTTGCAAKRRSPAPEFRPAIAAYDGEYREDPRMQAVLAELPSIYERALRDGQARSGLATIDPARIAIRIVDKPSEQWPQAWAFEETQIVNGRRFALITLVSSSLVLQAYDLEATLRHEVVHALLDQRPAAVPQWAHQGIATWSAGQLRASATQVIAGNWHAGRDPEALLDEFAAASTPGSLEAAMIFEWIASEKGEEAVRETIRAIASGIAPWTAVERTLGLSSRQRRTAFPKFEAAYLRQLVSFEEHYDFKAAQSAPRAESSVVRLGSFVQQHADSPLVPFAVFESANASARLGRWGDAIRGFDRIETDFPHHSALRGPARLLRAACLFRARDLSEARDELEVIVRDFKHEPELTEKARACLRQLAEQDSAL